MLVGTNRIATLHTRLARFISPFYGLRVIPCPVELPALNETIQWHKYKQHDLAVIWVKNQIKTVAQSLK